MRKVFFAVLVFCFLLPVSNVLFPANNHRQLKTISYFNDQRVLDDRVPLYNTDDFLEQRENRCQYIAHEIMLFGRALCDLDLWEKFFESMRPPL